MMKRMFLFLCICLGFHLTANADCCKPKNLRVSCSDNDGVVSITWANDCNSQGCYHSNYWPAKYTVTITGSINRVFSTGNILVPPSQQMFLPRGGSITVRVECEDHGSSVTGSCTRVSGGSINKPCDKAIFSATGYLYTYYVESIREWKTMCRISTSYPSTSSTTHNRECRVWFYIDEMLQYTCYDGYSPDGSWEFQIPSDLKTLYVKLIPGDGCGAATKEHYLLGRATISPAQAGTYYFTFTEVCK